MSLTAEERHDVVVYRIEKANLFERRLTGDYSDSYDLTEEDVMPLIEPTERLIALVSDLAQQAISPEQQTIIT